MANTNPQLSYTKFTTGIGNAKENKTLKNLNFIPGSYLYISHLDEDCQFWRLPVEPDSITDNMSSTFQSTNALGRSAPVFTYSYSGPRTVQIDLSMHRDMMEEMNAGFSSAQLKRGEDYMDSLIRALQSISVPKYNLSNKAVEPPLVAVRIENQIFIKGVVTAAIGITYSKPVLYTGQYADVKLSIDISEVDPYDASTVFTNGSFRGVVKTLKNKYMGFSEDD